MSQVQEIKTATSIVEIIGERLTLTQVGGRYKGLCPFHGEKTPSFMVSDDLGMFKCFGCGKGGDVFTFLEEYDGLSFSEALEYLANRAGIVLEKKYPARTKEDERRKQILTTLAEAVNFYEQQLAEPQIGKLGREYLQKRKVSADNRQLFHLGYANERWSSLTDFLVKQKKISLEVLVASGLTIKSAQGRYFDRFRQRLMFPLKNHRGQVVGFSGRWLGPEDAKEGKYINTPETDVYHKSELFYGLAENVLALKKAQNVVVVEGEFDMISSCQAHVRQTVAIKGSAFTVEQAKLIKRYVKQVILALDADNAGVEATRRAAKVLSAQGIALRIAVLPQGKDPDELAKSEPLLWRQTVEQAVSVYDFLIQALAKKYDLSLIEGKTQFLEELAPTMGEIKHAVEADYYLQKIARLLGVRADLVATDLRNLIKKDRLSKKSSPILSSSTTKSVAKSALDPVSALERYFLFLLLMAKTDTLKIALEKIKLFEPPLIFHDFQVKAIINQLAEFMAQNQTFSLEQFNQTLADDLALLTSEVYLDPHYANTFQPQNWTHEYQKTLSTLRRQVLQKKLQKINSQLELLDQKVEKTPADEEKQNQLLREIVNLQRQMK